MSETNEVILLGNQEQALKFAEGDSIAYCLLPTALLIYSYVIYFKCLRKNRVVDLSAPGSA